MLVACLPGIPVQHGIKWEAWSGFEITAQHNGSNILSLRHAFIPFDCYSRLRSRRAYGIRIERFSDALSDMKYQIVHQKISLPSPWARFHNHKGYRAPFGVTTRRELIAWRSARFVVQKFLIQLRNDRLAAFLFTSITYLLSIMYRACHTCISLKIPLLCSEKMFSKVESLS